MKKKSLGAGLFALASGLALGCSYKPNPIPNIAFEQCTYQFFSKDFQLGVEPFETSEECRGVFLRNLTNKNFLPVYLIIENISEDVNIKFDRDNIDFRGSDGAMWTHVSGNEMAHAYDEEDQLKAIFLGFAIGETAMLIDLVRSAEERQSRREDYKDKNVSGVESLFPGSRQRGFVYFKPNTLSREKFSNLLSYGEVMAEVYVEGNGRMKFTAPLKPAQSGWLCKNE